jgi:plasmid stabilization system protein ParE
MANVVFHPDAEVEFRASLSWYGRRSRRAAQGFERAMDRVLTTVASTPDRYPFYDDVYREAILTRYPYSLIYRVESNGDVLVVAVAHSSREPDYWRGRA